DDSLHLQCALVRSGVEESRHRYEVRNCSASHPAPVGRSESGGTTEPVRGNASRVHLRCPGAKDDDTIDVLWVSEGDWTPPFAARLTNSTGEILLPSQVCDGRLGVNPNGTLPGAVRRGVANSTDELTLLFAECDESLYLRCALVRSGVEEARSASALTLRCPDAVLEKNPVVEWFWQQGRNAHPVRSPEGTQPQNVQVAIPGVSSHSLDESTGDLTLIFHRCDLAAVFHCIVPAIGKVWRFTVRNCTSIAVGGKGLASVPASSSSERASFWLVVLASALFVGYPVG
ncbi:MAG: hypothetical protein ACRCUW_00945, partial [Plesiomonas shigelloides]